MPARDDLLRAEHYMTHYLGSIVEWTPDQVERYSRLVEAYLTAMKAYLASDELRPTSLWRRCCAHCNRGHFDHGRCDRCGSTNVEGSVQLRFEWLARDCRRAVDDLRASVAPQAVAS